MSRTLGATGKRTRKFARLVGKLERAGRLDMAEVIISLYSKSIGDGPNAVAAARLLLDRCVGPSVRRVELDVEVSTDPVLELLREIAEDRRKLEAGAIDVSPMKEPK